MKNKKLQKIGAFVLAGTIFATSGYYISKFYQTRKENTNSLLSSELEISKENMEDEFVKCLDPMTFNDISTNDFYIHTFSKSKTIASGEELRDYLISHDTECASVGEMYLTKDGKDIKYSETVKAEEKINSDTGEIIYVAQPGYVLEGDVCVKDYTMSTTSYSDLDDYELSKEVFVAYDIFDSKPRHYSVYRLNKK